MHDVTTLGDGVHLAHSLAPTPTRALSRWAISRAHAYRLQVLIAGVCDPHTPCTDTLGPPVVVGGDVGFGAVDQQGFKKDLWPPQAAAPQRDSKRGHARLLR
jgi:hypothetical protein